MREGQFKDAGMTVDGVPIYPEVKSSSSEVASSENSDEPGRFCFGFVLSQF